MDQLLARAIDSGAIPGSPELDALRLDCAADEGRAVAAANVLAQGQKFDAALAVLEARVEAEPRSIQALLTATQIRAHRGEVAAAIGEVGRVLRFEPTNAIALTSLAHLASGSASNPNDPVSLLRAMEAALKADAGRRSARGAVARAVLALLPEGSSVTILDGGARDAESNSNWSVLPRERLCYYGFEPARDECRRLNEDLRRAGHPGAYYPVGLWDREARLPFWMNAAPGGSSFLRQNRRVTDRWKFENPTQISLAREMFFETDESQEEVVDIRTWAAREGIAAVDFMKLNVQGGELAILQGAGPLLGSVKGLLVEVGFVESYEGRPFFSDIDAFLREAGFTFFDLLAHHYVGRADSPFTAQHHPEYEGRLSLLRSSWGQLIEGHALYLRDPRGDSDGSGFGDEDLVRLALVADVYGQTEFAFEMLAELAGRCEARGAGEARARVDRARDQALAELGGR